MNKNIVDGVIRVLKYNGREDLANLLTNSLCKIEESSTYGNYLYSVLCTLEIYSAYKKNKQLKELHEKDKNEILKAVLEIIPPKPYSQEISDVCFFYDMKLDDDNFENEINSNSGFNSKSIFDIESIDMNFFWNAFKAYITEIEDKDYLNNFNDRWIATYDGGYWGIDHCKVERSMIQEIGKGEYPLKNLPENKIIIKLIEFFFKNVAIPGTNNGGEARYDYTIRLNKLFDNFNLPLKLLKGKVIFKNSIILRNLLIHEDLAYLKTDPVLSELLNEAVTFFTDSQKLNIDTALEKIANSLERVKTIFDGSNKKKSTEKTIELLSKDTEIRDILDNHLKKLNLISNNYLIRHKEVNQKNIDSEELKQFLFYEFFNIIRFILKRMDHESK